MSAETVWEFKTARFSIQLQVEYDHGYQYDGDDEGGETQAALDRGDYVAFDSSVVVYLDNIEIARDSLGGNVYDASKVREFWTAHRDPDPMNRNCTAYRAKHGQNHVICHYFPDMVRQAVASVRWALGNVPHLRVA